MVLCGIVTCHWYFENWAVQSVWPDDGIKSCPIFHNNAQKVAKSFLSWKLFNLKYPKQLPEYLGYFWKKICHREFQKVAPSGHTV